jgi:hypothetical protein
MTPCPHRRTELFRLPFVVGDRHSYHVVELCQDCRRNVRGAGQWVPRSQVPDADRLPVLPRRRKGGAA